MKNRIFALTVLVVLLAAGHVISQTAENDASKDTQKLYVTPEDFGAVANDGKDDSDAFDKLSEAIKGNVAVYIPARRYHISRTWKIPFVNGGRIVGMGGLGHGSLKPKHPLGGANAKIYWIGEEGGTMVHVAGSNLVWDSVGLDGQKKAGVGLHMLKPEGRKGIGTGKHTFRGLSVVGCKTGLKLSEPGRHNTDSSIYEYTYFQDCEVGVMLNAHMVIGHYFTYLHFRRCKVGVWVRQGGDLVVRGGLNTSTDLFLKVGDEDGTAPGRNQAMFLFEGIKTDAVNKHLRWVDVVTPTDCSITFKNCHQAYTREVEKYKRKYVLRGAARLTIRDCVNTFGINSFVLEPGTKEKPEVYMYNPETKTIAVTDKIKKPNVVIERCRVDFGTSPDDWIEKDGGHFFFRVRDCDNGIGEPLKNFDE